MTIETRSSANNVESSSTGNEDVIAGIMQSVKDLSDKMEKSFNDAKIAQETYQRKWPEDIEGMKSGIISSLAQQNKLMASRIGILEEKVTKLERTCFFNNQKSRENNIEIVAYRMLSNMMIWKVLRSDYVKYWISKLVRMTFKQPTDYILGKEAQTPRQSFVSLTRGMPKMQSRNQVICGKWIFRTSLAYRKIEKYS